MKIRTVYLKVTDMKKAVDFWKSFFDIVPHKLTGKWSEFYIEGLRLGLLLNDFENSSLGSNCVPVFEFSDNEVMKYVERAKSLGAKIVYDGLNNPKMLSVVFSDPFGNEFEVSKFHD